MGNFSRGNTFRRRDDRSGGRDDRSGGREDRQMHRATCADCGKSCEVPFKPTGGKPVYCSNCFQREESPRGRADRSFGGGDNKKFGSRDERPRGRDERPSRGRDDRSFDRDYRPRRDTPRSSDAGSGARDSKKYEEINAKLDKILAFLQSDKASSTRVERKEAPSAPALEKKVVLKKAATKKTVSKEKVAKKVSPKKADAKKTTKKKVVPKKKSK